MKVAGVFLLGVLLAIQLACGKEERLPPARDRSLAFYTGLEVEPVYSRSFVGQAHSRHEFEPALQGDLVRHDFIIRNDSDEILEIHEVQGFPGCIVESYSRQVPPGLTGRISMLILTDSRGGEEIAGTIRARTSDADRPEITMDAGQMNQVLVNLVVNAIQAMPEGGTLTVRTRLAEDSIGLSVEDTGLGMSEELTKQIFLPFFTTKDVDQGTGLGLSVVQGIVEAHTGSTQVESTLGLGSKFTIRLPLSPLLADEDQSP